MSQNFSSEVIVLDSDGHQVGQMKLKDAQLLASNKGLDLIEVNKNGAISVCKIMDRGKWQYEQKKKHKKTHPPAMKEIQFGLRIHEHDQQIKINHIKEWLTKLHPVRIVVEMKGREKATPGLAFEKMNAIIGLLNAFYKPELASVKKSDSNVSVTLFPLHK